MKKALLLVHLVISYACYTQSNIGSTEQEVWSNRNIPPGYFPSLKISMDIDYSYKVSSIANANGTELSANLFLYNFISPEKWSEMLAVNDANLEYYQNAMNWFDALNAKVKTVFTLKELWYIYLYDQSLATQLLLY